MKRDKCPSCKTPDVKITELGGGSKIECPKCRLVFIFDTAGRLIMAGRPDDKING